jgi:hypothetical protein
LTLPGDFLVRLTALTIACLIAAGSAWAAATSDNLPKTDPTAANLTRPEIQTRAYDACLITQAKLLRTTQDALQSPCGCYAKRTVSKMNKTEVANFRATGYFDDSTRAKALEALDRCGLIRPI